MRFVKDLLVLLSAHFQLLNTEKLVEIIGLVPSRKQKAGKIIAFWKVYSILHSTSFGVTLLESNLYKVRM